MAIEDAHQGGSQRPNTLLFLTASKRHGLPQFLPVIIQMISSVAHRMTKDRGRKVLQKPRT